MDFEKLVKSCINLKAVDIEGKVVVNTIPVDENGKPIIPIEHIAQVHEKLQNEFPNNKVVTIVGSELSTKD